jgi:signal transduction histidine kinase
MLHLEDLQLQQREQSAKLPLDTDGHTEECINAKHYQPNLVKRLNDQIYQLQEQNKAKDKILTLVSHDIKGPLGSLHALVALQDKPLSDEEQSFIKQSIKEQVQNLNEIVDSMFRWASLSFKSDVRKEKFDLTALVTKCFLHLENAACVKKIKMETELCGNIFLEGNADQIAFAIRNILANAVKFTPTNGNVLVKCTKTDEWSSVHIKDTGIGLSPLQMASLFTPNQVSTFGTNGEKGTGFGLWLCQEYIQVHKGKIVVESEQHKGSTFSIMLPNNPTEL